MKCHVSKRSSGIAGKIVNAGHMTTFQKDFLTSTSVTTAARWEENVFRITCIHQKDTNFIYCAEVTIWTHPLCEQLYKRVAMFGHLTQSFNTRARTLNVSQLTPEQSLWQCIVGEKEPQTISSQQIAVITSNLTSRCLPATRGHIQRWNELKQN